MEGCRNPALNPFWMTETTALRMICKAGFYRGSLQLLQRVNPISLSARRATLAERGSSVHGWEQNQMALIRRAQKAFQKARGASCLPPILPVLGTKQHFPKKVHSH